MNLNTLLIYLQKLTNTGNLKVSEHCLRATMSTMDDHAAYFLQLLS